MKSDLVFPNKKQNPLILACGILLGVVIFPVFFLFLYGIFFDRKNHYNRIALYQWLQDNPLPEPEKVGHFVTWYIGPVEITYDSEKWYVFEGSNCLVCSFHKGNIFDKRRYQKIEKMLIKSATGHGLFLGVNNVQSKRNNI